MSAIERIREEKIVAVLRHVLDIDAAVARLAAAGISLIEITLDSEGALEAIRRTPGALAGTVRTPEQVEAAYWRRSRMCR